MCMFPSKSWSYMMIMIYKKKKTAKMGPGTSAKLDNYTKYSMSVYITCIQQQEPPAQQGSQVALTHARDYDYCSAVQSHNPGQSLTNSDVIRSHAQKSSRCGVIHIYFEKTYASYPNQYLHIQPRVCVYESQICFQNDVYIYSLIHQWIDG